MPIELEHRDGVAVVVMRNGENRMNRAWLDAMHAALDEVVANPASKALVTAGEDRFYSNGLDLDWLLQPDTEPMPPFVADVERLLARLLVFPMVTVAACNGHTFAAGALLALSHDLRVMRADRGFFCLPEVDIKIPFTPGMDALIRSRLPVPAAHEAMVTGKRFGGTEAAAKGIVTEAVPGDAVLERAVAVAAGAGGKDRAVLASIKHRMYGGVVDLLADSAGTEPA